MKRLVLVIILLLVTGCGESSINCIKEQKRDYITINQNMLLNFKGKKLENAKYDISATLIDKYKDSSTHLTDILKSEFLSFEKDYGIKLNVQNSDASTKISMDITKENFDKIYISDKTKSSKDNIIELFQKNGYTCN